MSDPEFILEPIPLADLRLDARYQRDVDERVVAEIVNNYHPEQFQPVTVGMRDDSTLHVVDGQHRVSAARRMGWKSVPCMVFESRGFEHEAEVFERLQTARRPLSVGQRWKARVARREPVAVGVSEIVASLGLQLTEGRTNKQGTLYAFVACEQAYERGNLHETLTLIIQSWEYDPIGFRSNFVTALSMFLTAMNAEHAQVDLKRVADAMRKIRPASFLREVSIIGNANAAFMRRLLDAYNSGLRSGRIVVDDPLALLKTVAARRSNAATSPEARSERSRNAAAALTTAQRSANGKKGHVARRERRSRGAAL